MRTRKLHPELKSLLQNLAGDTEIPDEALPVSEASRQKVDQIVAEINQEQGEPVPEPRPVYSRPPRHKKILRAPVPVEHFSEEPSQNPAVRMHDRLLQDAMPKPDPERRPRRMADQDIINQNNLNNLNKNNIKKTRKSGKSRKAGEKNNHKKIFHIQIGELPPDIPRDTSVADRLREEQLAQTLASVPPQTPEQRRKEQVRKRALKIREQIRLQEELALQESQSREIPSPEPEEDIPAWEDKLAEFLEKHSENSADQLRIFNDSVTEILMTPKAPDPAEIATPNLQFEQTVVLQTVSMQNVRDIPGAEKVRKAQKSQKSRKKTAVIRKAGKNHKNLHKQGGC